MSRFLLLVMLVAACHAAPRPQQPVLSQHTETPRATPNEHVEIESPDWVPHTRRGRTVVTSTSITLLDDLRFKPGSAIIEKKTLPILDAFAQTMVGNPSLQLVAVRVFAADVAPQWQQIVADLRARTVVDYVVAQGVSRSRLRPQGVALPPPGVKARLQFEIVVRGP
jgi:outer membrane protein OmpA-like peptidoglycan-associated protein